MRQDKILQVQYGTILYDVLYGGQIETVFNHSARPGNLAMLAILGVLYFQELNIMIKMYRQNLPNPLILQIREACQILHIPNQLIFSCSEERFSIPRIENLDQGFHYEGTCKPVLDPLIEQKIAISPPIAGLASNARTIFRSNG